MKTVTTQAQRAVGAYIDRHRDFLAAVEEYAATNPVGGVIDGLWIHDKFVEIPPMRLSSCEDVLGNVGAVELTVTYSVHARTFVASSKRFAGVSFEL
jgi:hypothetical protein